MITKERVTRKVVLVSLLAACIGLFTHLYVREVTFISVTCKDPKLSYTGQLDDSYDFKCDWSGITFERRLALTYFNNNGE